MEMIKHPRAVIGENGWPLRIYSGIDWSLSQGGRDGEHLHWVCTKCQASHHGSREWAVSHAATHGLVWDAQSQCMLMVANATAV